MSTILVGSAPDSWGVWFPDDPNQTPYTRFLDEVAASGYEWIELGPFGYLPTDPKKLSDELAGRGLKLSAGTVFEHLHQDESWDAVWTQIEDVAKLTAAVGGKHVVVIPEMWRDPATGEVLEDRNLTTEQWRKKTHGMNELGKAMFEKYGVRAQYHPHADTHVDTEENVYRFLDGTDTEFVNLCLDTGHISYCGGDNLAIIERAPERIGYLHLKQVDPEVRAKVEAEDLPFGEAVKLGAMTEPPLRNPGHATAARSHRAPRHRRLRHRRAGHVPLRGRRPTAHRPTHPQLSRVVRRPVREVRLAPRYERAPKSQVAAAWIGTMPDPAVLVERDGHVLTLTLNRPEKRNAFNAEVLCRLADAWDLLDGDPDLRVAIITGAGGNFSAGADLDRLVGALMPGKPAENEFEERIREDFSLIYKGFLKDHYVKKPIVAAVEGYCYAGGMEILQAFDIRVAAEDAQLAVTEVQRGLFPMVASTIRLPAPDPVDRGDGHAASSATRSPAVGPTRSAWSATSPRDGGALAKARELADRLAANGPLAVRNIKASVIENLTEAEAEAFRREQESAWRSWVPRTPRKGHARSWRSAPRTSPARNTLAVMNCCHYHVSDGCDGAFSVDASRITFGRGCIDELGHRARRLGMTRVALFSDAGVARLPFFDTARRSLASAGLDVVTYTDVRVEPTDASFQDAARFAARRSRTVCLGGRRFGHRHGQGCQPVRNPPR